MKQSRAETQKESRAMKDKSVKRSTAITPEVPELAPRGWAGIQKTIAEIGGHRAASG